MARSVSIITPSAVTDKLLDELGKLDDLLGLQVNRGVSIQPPGDVVSLTVPNRQLNRVMRILDNYGLGKEGGLSISTSEVAGFIPTGQGKPIERDNNEATWEEMEMTISDDSNSTPNTLLTMFVAGSLATAGLATNALHIVVGAMLLAPGFMPLLRVALVLVGRRKAVRWGLEDFVKNYVALIVGAIATTFFLLLFDYDPLNPRSTYYVSNQTLVSYWTTVTLTSTFTSVASALAGALLVATRRSVFTSGVMVGLALVPTAALIGVGLARADVNIIGLAAVRFVLEVTIVFCVSWLTLLWNKHYLYKRNIKL